MSYEPERVVVPTQVAHPWRATIRTIVAGVLAALIVAAVVWALVVGADVEVSVEAVVSATILVAGAITKVMANPAVNQALEHLNLGAGPREE